jgi:hypothetical protein
VRRWPSCGTVSPPLRANREPFGEHPFAALLGTFEGVTIPTLVTAGWFYGTPRWQDGEFLRARIAAVEWR